MEAQKEMPRYFFHLQSENVMVPDEKGREFQGVEDAHFHAQMIVRGALRYLDDEDGRWTVRIERPSSGTDLIVLFPKPR
jgi:hypothetical protein